MKVSKYLEIFRALSYPSLFSGECLDAVKNIQQSDYGKLEASQAIYEINLSKRDLTADVSFRIHDDFLKTRWLEFDFKNYSSDEKLQPCIFLEHDAFEDHEALSQAFGYEKWEKFRKPVDKLKILLKDKRMCLKYLGNMGSRNGKFSETIRVEVLMRTHQKAGYLLNLLNYRGDLALFENTVSEFEPYALNHIFSFSFDLFPDGEIADRV